MSHPLRARDGWLARRYHPNVWLESLSMTLVVPVIGILVNSQDPFLLQQPFPWLLLGALMPALRYGFAMGFAGSLLLVGLLWAGQSQGWVPGGEFPDQFALGLVITAMIAGEFSDHWQKQVVQQRIINEYQDQRLNEFTRSYHLLKVSHDKLEHRMASASISLREALLMLRKRLLEERGEGDMLDQHAGTILHFFSDYALVRVAALYRVEGSQISLAPLAGMGKVPLLQEEPEVMRLALEQKKLFSVRELENTGNGSSVLAVVPVVDVEGGVHALVVIYEMPFIAMQDQNLRLLAVLAGAVGDMLAVGGKRFSGEVAGVEGFCFEIRRALAYLKNFRLNSMLVSVVIGSSVNQQLLSNFFMGQVRGLDRALLSHDQAGNPVIWLLMPMTSHEDFASYQNRIHNQIKFQFGLSSDDLGIRMYPREITQSDSLETLVQFHHEVSGIDVRTIADL